MNKIEGGPACPECVGFGDAWDPTWRNGGYRPQDEGGVPCPACQGTGRKPLSEWTDAQKAEWLWNQKYKWRPVRLYDDHTKKYSVEIQFEKYTGNTRTWQVIREDFSAALTAAVEAVAKEKE